MADHDSTSPGSPEGSADRWRTGRQTPDGPEKAAPDPSDSDSSRPWTAGRVLRTAAVTLAGIIGAVIVLLLLFVAALQTNWGGMRFADFLMELGNPFSESITEYDELRGNFITRLEFRDLRMYRPDTVYVDTVGTDPLEIRHVRSDGLDSPADAAAFDTFYVDTLFMAAIDTFRLRYNLLRLLRREVHFDEITLANPVINARRQPDGGWDVLEPFGADTAAADEAAFSFVIDALRITDGELTAVYDPPDADSLFRVADLYVQAGDIRIADDVRALVDTLHGSYSPPGQDYWTDLRAGGSLVDSELHLAGLTLESPRSLVNASGSLRLPSAEEEMIRDIDFDLRADPLAFGDLHPFFPALNPDRSATVRLEVGGSERLMHVDAEAQLSDGGSLTLSGAVSPTTEGPVEYRAEAVLNRFDPLFFTGTGPPETLLNGTVDVDLAGTDLEALDGTASAELSQSTLAGLDLASGRLQAGFTDGRADVDLATTWNGSTIVAEGFIRPFDETPSYELSGRTTGLNAASFGADDQQTDINATFDIRGYGFEASTAELDAELQIARSTVNDYVVDSGTFQMELAGGQMSFGARMLFPDGLIVANGEANLDDPVTYRVSRGRLENVDLAALLGQDARSSVNAAFSLQGTGTEPRQMNLTAVLDVEPSTYGTYRLEDGRIRLDLEAGLLNATAVADFAEAGRFDLAAVMRPFDDVEVLRITRGEFSGVDVGALLDDPEQSSDLNGTLALTLRGFDPQTMRLDGSLSLAASRLNEQAISSASADVRLARGTLSFSADVATPEGGASFAGTAQPFRTVPTYEIAEGRFENVNLAAFTGNPELQSDLDGTLALSGTGSDPESMTLRGRLDLGPSQINEQIIESAFVEGRLEDGTAELDLALSVPDGTTRLTGTVRPFLDTPTYEITQGTFRGVDVGALTGNPDWRTNLGGEISLSGRGFDPAAMQAEGTVRLDSSRVNDVRITGGSITGAIVDGLADFDVDVSFADGSAQVAGEGRLFDEVPTYDVAGTLTNVRLGDLMATDTLAARVTGTFALEGRGTDPASMDLSGRIIASDAFYEGTEVDTLYSHFELTSGVLRVDSLLLESTALDARGNGSIALFDTTAASDFYFDADIKSLQPFRRFIAAETLQLEEGRLEGRVYGRPGMLRFDATGTLRSFIYNDVRLAEFDGTVAGEYEPGVGLTIAEVQGEMQSISIPQLLIERADVNVTYTPDGIRFDGSVRIEPGRHAELAGFVDTGPDARRIVLEQLQMTLDGDEWQLLQQATITYGERYRVSNLLLYSDDQQLAVDGVIDPTGEQNLVVTIESVEMGPFADLLGYEGLGGTVNGSLVLSGPAESPVMEGTLLADVTSYDDVVGDLRLQLEYEELRLNLDALLTHEDGSMLTAEGFLPLDLRVARLDEGGMERNLAEGEVDLVVHSDSFSVGWIQPFLDPETVNEFAGRLTADIRIGGTTASPVLDGSAHYTQGRIGLPELGVTYRDIRAHFALQQNRVRVTDFVIEAGGGSIRGDGTINLAELTLGEFNIDLRADDFMAISSPEYRFVVDGNMVLTGTTQRPRLEGDVEVITGEIVLTEQNTGTELEQVQLTTQEIQTVERRFGVHITAEDTTTFSLYDALAMDLDVQIERNTWIRSRVNPIMDIQFSGRLELQKDHYEDVNVYGTIEVVPQRSRIVQFGRRFDITSGTLTFRGPAGDPLIDVQAEYEVRQPGFRGQDPNVTITLSVEGQMSEQLDLTLGSDPQMEYTDIVSYIATGQPASAALQLGGGGGQALLGAGAGLALDQLTAIMEGLAEAGLGLDVVTLDQTEGQTRITAGTYVTPRLFVSVSQPVTGTNESTRAQTNRPLFTIEYEIQNWLLAQLTERNQVLRLNLQFAYSY